MLVCKATRTSTKHTESSISTQAPPSISFINKPLSESQCYQRSSKRFASAPRSNKQLRLLLLKCLLQRFFKKLRLAKAPPPTRAPNGLSRRPAPITTSRLTSSNVPRAFTVPTTKVKVEEPPLTPNQIQANRPTAEQIAAAIKQVPVN